MDKLNVTLVEDNAALAHWVDIWRAQPAIGLDTEFIRTDTFYPVAGLIQVSCPGHEVLVDPLAITDLAPLTQLLADTRVTKVLHACGEDLEVFQRLLGELPQPLFDTQIAAAFLGMGLSIGHQRLVEAELEITLPASETRSNWLQRPLSDSQLLYAAADVHCLLPLYQSQLAQLQAKDFVSAATQEFEALIEDARQGRDPSLYYLKMRGAWRLGRGKQQVLQALCVWREAEARARNIPRSRVASDALLIAMAQDQPNTVAELSQCEGVTHRQLKQDADVLLKVIRESRNAGGSQVPLELIPRPLAKTRKDLYGRLRDRVKALSDQLAIPDSLLCKKAVLEKLADTVPLDHLPAELPVAIEGWRADILVEPLRYELNVYIEEQLKAGQQDPEQAESDQGSSEQDSSRPAME